MANRVFRKYVQALGTGVAGPDLSSDNFKAAAIDTGTYSPDTTITGDEFLSDLSGIITTTGNLANITFVDGVFDADDVQLPDVGGASIEVLVIYHDTGVAATSRLLWLIDTATGLPLTPDSTNDLIQWHEDGVAVLG